MLEDSITSSPSKSNKSIHERRLIRKNKRKKAEGDHHQVPSCSRHITIHDFYHDSEEVSTYSECKDSTFAVAKPSAIIKDYRPFEMEKTLAMADHISMQQKKINVVDAKTNIWPETQGFLSCLNLTQLEKENPKDLRVNNKSNVGFSITDSELISCCHSAEKILQNEETTNSLLQELSPKKEADDMFLVNSILADFSLSPLSIEQIKMNTFHQHTPEFRLRRVPIKTYSRKFLNTTKINLNKQFEEQAITVEVVSEDDNHSHCSSLSIQEDVIAAEISNEQQRDTAIPNISNTQHLCENLLNLSAYFAQNNRTPLNLSDENPLDSKDQDVRLFLNNIPDLIKDIHSFRSKYYNRRYDSFNSLDDFHGFQSSTDHENDVIDMDCTEEDIMETTLTHDFIKENTSRLESSFNGDEVWNDDDDSHDILAAINTEAILQQENIENSNNIKETAEFAYPQMPKDNEIPATTENIIQEEIHKIGFRTASSKPIKVSREAHIMAAKILSKLPELPQINSKPKNCDTETLNKDVNIFENPENYEWNDDCDLFLNFQTPITPNEIPIAKPQQQLNANELQDHSDATKMPSVGFKTAGGKHVHISKKAQDSVQKLLKEFTNNNPLDNFNCEEELKEMKSKVYAKTHNLESNNIKEIKTTNNPQNSQPVEAVPSTSKVSSIGFKTAGGKDVHISKKAQDSVQKLLKEFTNSNPLYNFNCEEELKEIKSKVYAKTHNLESNKSPLNNVKDIKTTDNIQTFQQVEVVPSTSKASSLGFKTAGGKDVHISKKAQESVQKLLNEFTSDNPLDNFNCEEELKEMKSKIYTKTHNLESSNITDIKSTNNKQNSLQQEEAVPSTSKASSLGFITAGGKNVHISKKAQESVQKLLKEFMNSNSQDNFNCEEELKEMKSKVYAKAHNLETNKSPLNNVKEIKTTNNLQTSQQEEVVPSTSKVSSLGFKTASGRDVHISKKAQDSVQKLLSEFTIDNPLDNFNCEEELKEMKSKIYTKTHNLESNKSPLGNVKEPANNLQTSKQEEVVPSTSKVSSIGFKTARGKDVHISKKAQESVQQFLKEFTNSNPLDNFNCEEELKEMKSKIYTKTHNFASKESTLKDSNHNMFTETQQNADQLLNEICMEAEQNFENCPDEHIEDLKDQAESELKNNEHLSITIENKGFQTANGKRVTISAKAQKMVETLLQECNTNFDIENCENDLMEMKTKMQIKNKKLKHNNSNIIEPKSSQIKEDNADISEGPTNSKNLTPKPKKYKRKLSIEQSDITSPDCSTPPPAKRLNKGLYSSKSSFSESLKSPLSPHPVITRKNLLSLTNRHRSKRKSLKMPNEEIPKIHKEKYDLNVSIATPSKTCMALGISGAETPATPNLKEFISNAALTSTPRLNILSESPKTIKETDFKPINWKDNNHSFDNKTANNTSSHTTKLSETSSVNITLNSSNPTAQERIGRLKMYGKAPDVSPILIETHNNCRPSGLRRTRSMLKKT